MVNLLRLRFERHNDTAQRTAHAGEAVNPGRPYPWAITTDHPVDKPLCVGTIPV